MTLPPAPQDALPTIYRRRAIRSYSGQQPDDRLIGELVDAAIQAPTAMHMESWAFVVIQDKTTLKRYSDLAKAMLLKSNMTGNYNLGKHISQDHLNMLADPAFNIFYNAGTLIVVCRKISAPFADADCWLAAQNLMLSATARALGTCCIGFAVPVLNTAEAKQELSIPAGGAAVAPLIVGFPSGSVPSVSRKPPVILRWIK